MSTTSFGLNDDNAVKLWAKTLDVESIKATDIMPLIGEDTNSIIHRKVETSKGTGDRVRFSLRMQLSGDGFSESDVAEGNGEGLTLYKDDVTINELGHVVGVKSENTIDAQRIPFDLREEARDGLADWWATRLSTSFFNQVCGNTVQTDTKYSGLQAVIAPSSTRILRQSSRATDQALTSADTFTLAMVNKAKELAITATPKIRPINVEGRGKMRDYNNTLTDKYVMYLHPWQVTDLQLNTSNGNWQEMQKAAMMGGQVTNNPLYSGALGEWDGVILRQSFHIPLGVHSTAGTAVTGTRRSVLLGAQAAACAYGEKSYPGKYRWNEEMFDHKRKLEVSAWAIFGLKKTVFNSTDYGTVVVSTYAAAHT